MLRACGSGSRTACTRGLLDSARMENKATSCEYAHFLARVEKCYDKTAPSGLYFAVDSMRAKPNLSSILFHSTVAPQLTPPNKPWRLSQRCSPARSTRCRVWWKLCCLAHPQQLVPQHQVNTHMHTSALCLQHLHCAQVRCARHRFTGTLSLPLLCVRIR